MTHTTLNVEGMSCGHCKKRAVTRDPWLSYVLRNRAFSAVEGELDKLFGVERSDADFERGVVEVYYDEGRVTAESLGAAVEEAGYSVVSRRG